MTCVECGTGMGTSGRCPQCGAPVVERPEDEPRGTQTVSQESAKGSFPHSAMPSDEKPETSAPVPGRPAGPDWGIRIVIGFLNLAALWFLVAFVGMYRSQGTPSAAQYGYPPAWACLVGAVGCSIVPALTVVVLVCSRMRRARERRALKSDMPVPLPESFD